MSHTRSRKPSLIVPWLTAIAALVAVPAALAWMGAGRAVAQQALHSDLQPGAAKQSVAPPAQTPGCTPTWGQVSDPDTTNFSDYQAVYMAAGNDAWAVGAILMPGALSSDTLIKHWDGASWSTVSSYSIDGLDNILEGIAGVSASDIWAVGSGQGAENDAITLHWNGTEWQHIPSPDPHSINQLTGVSAIATNDVWAVGEFYHVSANSQNPRAIHWDGTAWTPVTVPSPGGEQSNSIFNAVSAVASNDVWAVGYGSQYGQPEAGLTEHWDGTSWSIIPNPSASGSNLSAVAVLSPTDVWAAGYTPSGLTTGLGTRSLIMHWDGTSWSVVPSPDVEGTGSRLRGMVAVAPNDVWAVGSTIRGCCFYRALAEHWDGTQWSIAPSFSSGSGNRPFSVAASGADNLLAVGEYSADNRIQTLVEQYTGQCPAPTPAPTVCPITFSDVPPSSPFYAAQCLACHGVVSGYSDGTFRPNQIVTRAQMSKYIANAADISDPANPAPGVNAFTDVGSNTPFYVYIARLYNQQIISGYPCGTPPAGPCNVPFNSAYFLPNNPVSRGQAAKLIAKAAFYTDPIPASQQTFSDVAPGSPFWTEVEQIYIHTGVRGYACGPAPAGPCDAQNRPYYLPGGLITRGQAAKFVAGAFYSDCGTNASGGDK